METFTDIILGATATYLLASTCFLHTKNVRSALLFKFIPAVLGSCLLFLLLKEIGFIVAVN